MSCSAKQSVARNELARCRDAPATFPLPTAVHHEGDEGFPGVFFVNVLPLWCVLAMHHPTGVKANGQHHFNVALHLPDLFWPRGC